MTKEEVLQHGVIDAPSAYAGLKDVAKDYLASVGKADEKVKAAGGDTCFCPACTNGKFVLDHQDLLLR